MPMQWTTVPIPLGVAGIDTRTDPRLVPPPALLRAENVTFGTPGALRKRPGGARLAPTQITQATDSSANFGEAAISGAKGIVRFGDRLLMETDIDLLAYNAAIDRWHPIGPAPGMQVSYESGAGRLHLETIDVCDMAYADGLLVTVWSGTNMAGTTSVRVSVRDVDTGHEINFSDDNLERPRAAAVGDTIVVMGRFGTTLRVYPIRRAAMVSWGSSGPSVIVTALTDSSLLYEVAPSGGRLLVAYLATGGDIKYGYLTPNGVVDGSFVAETPAASPTVLACAVESTTRRFLVAWAINSNNTARVRMFAEDQTALFATTSLLVSDEGNGYTQCVAAFTSATRAHVFLEIGVAAVSNRYVRHSTVTNAGVVGTESGSGVRWHRHSGLASKPWVYNGRAYVMLVHDSPLQATYFIARASDYPDFGAEAHGIRYWPSRDYAIVGCLFPSEAIGVWTSIGMPSVVDLGDGRFRYGARICTRLGEDGLEDVARLADVVFDHVSPGQWVDVGDALIGTGALVWQTDGQFVSEMGFLLWPEGITATTSAGSGSIAPGTYLYRVFRERTWPDGRREQSTAVEVEVVVPTGHNTVTLAIPSLDHTNWTPNLQAMRGVRYGVYRSLEGETICHRVSDVSAVEHVTTNPTVNGYLVDIASQQALRDVASYGFEDRLSDDAIADNETDYLSAETTDGLTEVENLAAPGCSIIATGNNRVFLGGFRDPNEIRASKLRGFGEPLAFSTLAAAADAGDGPLVALAALADSLLAFREHEVYVIAGEGPDNLNRGGEYVEARTASSDIGCIEPRSIVRIPAGILFQSRKGFYIFAGEGFAYVGAAVERYKDETVVAALALPDSHEVRFVLASGTTLLFDYLAQQWATWTVGGIGACVWQRQFCRLADSTGIVVVEDEDVFADDGTTYQLIAETAEIRLGALQGAQRIRRALFRGELRGTHRARVWAAFNGSDTWMGPFDWRPAAVVSASLYGAEATYGAETFGGTGASTVYQFEVRLPRQKCQTVRFRIEDAPDGAALGDSFSLSEMALEIGVRRSPVRLEAARRTG